MSSAAKDSAGGSAGVVLIGIANSPVSGADERRGALEREREDERW
jgi:hypothetical protein